MTGPIPEVMLRRFEEEERKRLSGHSMAKRGRGQGAEAAVEVVAGFRRRGGQRRLRWYTRHHAWEVASKLYSV